MRRFSQLTGAFAGWLRTTALDPVGGLGIILTTLSAVLFLVSVGASLVGFPFSHYAGIFIYVILPVILMAGLVLIPIGRWRVARNYPGGRMPKLDFENPRHLKKVGMFAAMTVMNLLIFGFAGFGGYHYSESSEFCGLTCHTVMEPEWTAYQLSPHSRVDCVECHIGPGTGWFVRSKLSGARQVLAVMTGDYSRPVETPIANLRPARETCEQCHWPEQFHGDKLETIHKFESDEDNTALKTVLLLKVGGGSRNGKAVGGIHWHTHPSNRITFVSTDHSREEIPYIRIERDDGSVEEFVAEDFEGLDELLASREPREMDCMDCHNRPTHVFHPADEALDQAIADGRLDRSIPWLRRNALIALRTEVAADEDPAARFLEVLREAYADEGLDETQLAEVADELGTIWGRNVFPAMDITWDTYPSFLGHKDDGGCFRCHDDSHVAESGRTISGDCDTCHSLLAWDEEEPEILDALYEGTQ